jgi:eukaryotic-like serine/threonine-protein kinase
MQRNRSFLKLIALHLSLMAAFGSSVLFLFFRFLLPVLTHHGQYITVPNLKGISLEEVDICLAQRNLRFEVTEECAYAPEYPPMTVLQQYPKAGAHVKKGRKIYLTLNTKTPPQVKMPDLIDGSVRNAHVRLKSQGLLLGAIKYVPDVAQNAVLEQWYQDKEIAAETLVAKGARIDLVVGAGLGNKMSKCPK